MQNHTHINNPIQIPIERISAQALIQRLSDENFQLTQTIEIRDQTIDKLTNQVALLKESNQQLKDEISILKGQQPKPDIRPSCLEGPKSKRCVIKIISIQDNKIKIVKFSLFCLWAKSPENTTIASERICCATRLTSGALHSLSLKISPIAGIIIKKVKRIGKKGQPQGKLHKAKTSILKIHDKPIIQPNEIPAGAVFKGYRPYTVQDIIFETFNTQYQIARWKLADGSYISGKIPKGIHGHYGPTLVTYILHQYHACRVTEPLLLEQLHVLGVLISAGQLNNILIENKDAFIKEVEELLPIATVIEGELQVDDTGGRHKGKNQYTTIIGNRWFTVFATTDSKSRVNFLKLLQGGKEEYLINEDTVEYLKEMNAAGSLHGYIAFFKGQVFMSLLEWKQFLEKQNITKETDVRWTTEAALYANVIKNGIPRNLGVHSDDAGQFDVFHHSLCWIHEERHYRKLIMVTDEAKSDLKRVTEQIWTIYQELKAYKNNPNERLAETIEKQFNDIFQQATSSPTLNHQLKKTHQKKQELLMVLKRHKTPLHNNSSETCARSAKIKLKISGGTRSDLGKTIRDIFLSLKQTCLKLSINFFSFLQDRVSELYVIPRLALIIKARSLPPVADPPS